MTTLIRSGRTRPKHTKTRAKFALLRLALPILAAATLAAATITSCAHTPPQHANTTANSTKTTSTTKKPTIRNVQGFSAAANSKIRAFLKRSANVKGRKVAVFDGDGTVFGQTPHYLADECLYAHAKAHPSYKPKMIETLRKQSNVSLPYVQNRIHYLSSMTLNQVRALGQRCFDKWYSDKIYPPMRDLVTLLKANSFEVWVVTASPEALYQQFLSRALSIPITRVIGVKSIVRGGVVSDDIIEPVPQDRGKLEAIETFVQTRPLLVGGNSRGDKEMIEYASDLHLIVNPDEHVAPDQKQSIADFAKRAGWVVVRVHDVPNKAFPAVSSKQYNVRLNKSHAVTPN